MSDLISRQAAINAIIAKLDSIDHVPQWVFDELTGVIGNLPSAQPEIIRCKDCKNWQTDWTPICSNFTPEDHFCSLVDLVTEDDFFCGYAERKDNG